MGKRNRHLPIGVALCLVMYVGVGVMAEFNFDDDLEDLIAEESNVDEEVFGESVLPSDVFNGGKPFYVERDPSTGAIDFKHKKTTNQISDLEEKGLFDNKDSHVSDTKDVVLSQSTPNFHDFLNLPVKYSPSNFVYPLISSSYSNLKYQGSNKIFNHKNFTSPPSTTTSAPKFQFTRPQYTTTGRLNVSHPQTSSTVSNVTQSSTRYTYPTTSGRPITTTTTTTTTANPTTTSTTRQLFTRYPYKSTIKNKYLETTENRKKFFLPSTLSLPSTTTTQKPQSTAPIRSSTYYSPSIRPWTNPSSAYPTTTPVPSTESRPSNPIRFVEDRRPAPEDDTTPKIKFTIPALKYEGNRPAPFRPLPPSHVQQLNRQNDSTNKIDLPKNPAVMSLSDIFNSLGLDDKQAAAEEQENAIVFETTVAQTTERTTPPAIVLIPDNQRQQNSAQQGPTIEQSIDLSDQYVKYEVEQQNERQPQQTVDEQYVHYEINQPNGHRPQGPSQDTDLGNQYVKYEVQQPQMNVVKFGTVPSMNSMVISPNQHSATFVLGSQQSVGSSSEGHFIGSVSQEPSSAALSGHPAGYQMGQVLDEPNQTSNVQVGASVNVQVKPQDIIKTTSVRFPSESDDKYDNAPIISGTHKSEVLPPNGHSAPVAMGSNQVVVFPKNEKIDSTLHEVSNRIVFDTPNNDELNKNELPSYSPSLPEQLTPPSSGENGQLSSKRPRPPIPAQGPPFIYKEIQRRPYPGDRTRPPLQLPNILPQFRPNAKISHGHPHFHKESGTYRVPPGQPGKTLPPNMPHLRKPYSDLPPAQSLASTMPIRRAPVPTRFMSRINTGRPQNMPPMAPYIEGSNENRRYYRLPPPLLKERIFHITPPNMKPPPPPPVLAVAQPGGTVASRLADSYAPSTPENLTPNSQSKNTETNEFLHDPPTILKNAIKEDKPQRPKLEPVVTLQMLQSKKQAIESQKHNLPTGQKVDLSVEAHPPVGPAQTAFSSDGKQPVYVVYPVKSTPMKMDSIQAGSSVESVVVGQRGEPVSHASSKISPGTEYQNTPFSIASHFEQEPILMAKEKKHHQKLHFPYSLETPDPVALAEMENESKHRLTEPPVDKKQDTIYNIGEEPISREQSEEALISSKLQRATESTPIAIAYTPTEPTLKYKYNLKNSPYYSPYGETQTEVSYLKMDEFDEFGNPAHRYEQSFQAPFQASISLDPVKVTNPYEGWAVVTSSPQALVQEQNKIDRSDDHRFDEHESTSKKPQENGAFQPEFQGGFRPIYGEDVKLSDVENPDPQSRNPFVVPDSEEAKPVDNQRLGEEHDKKPLFDSLEALFDDLTKDYDDNTETTGMDDDEDVEESTAKDTNELEGRSNDKTVVSEKPVEQKEHAETSANSVQKEEASKQ
ncbi:mucin-2 [Malaya genurostris]|uniref:mucin-2 n=1 Tax=Malaya genurostris TaxID=325434 RepID=UPI0026F38C75|nr:mucin-2 [Malaya genurostris]